MHRLGGGVPATLKRYKRNGRNDASYDAKKPLASVCLVGLHFPCTS